MMPACRRARLHRLGRRRARRRQRAADFGHDWFLNSWRAVRNRDGCSIIPSARLIWTFIPTQREGQSPAIALRSLRAVEGNGPQPNAQIPRTTGIAGAPGGGTSEGSGEGHR
jgi:hypothetical protein